MTRLWALALTAFCFLAPTDRVVAFAGAYASREGDATLVLVRDPDGDFEGIWVMGERTFHVEGELEDGRLVADCFGTGAGLDEERHLVATPADSVLLVQFMPLDDDDEPDWSRAATWPLLPVDGTALPPSTSTQARGGGGSEPGEADQGATTLPVGDPGLVGRWVRSQSMSSGDLTMVSQATFVIGPDGAFAAGGAELVGGGSLGAVESGPGGEVITGQWTAEGQIFYIRNVGSEDWIPLARYHVEGTSLLLIFFDDTRELWTRT